MVYQMRTAQKEAEMSSRNYHAREKARIYERKVDAELLKIKS